VLGHVASVLYRLQIGEHIGVPIGVGVDEVVLLAAHAEDDEEDYDDYN